MSLVHYNLGVICVLMFVGPLLTGAVPLAIDVGSGWTKWVELLGAGVIVGSAFAVVLPEGFEALYASSKPHAHGEADDHPDEESLLIIDPQSRQHARPARWLPGAAILAGFLTMLVTEFSLHKAAAGSHSCTQAHGCKHSSAKGGLTSSAEEQTVGIALLFHAASDGLAVGVACMSTSTRLAVAIGLAMVLHKGPVAFGLSAYLIAQQAAHSEVLKVLLLFALAAPVTALLSYGILRHFSGPSSGTFVAMCVLFSAGTFVYAACDHMLPDLSGDSPSWSSIVILCLGALVPCSINLINFDHH